ncbi:MAG: L,D-transpeptidase family protein, partial [Gammaproteobacteria bacterium]
MTLVIAALVWIAATAAAAGAEPQVPIRDKVEALQSGERVEIDGATIAAKTFLSDLYRRRDFRPLWSAAATVQLLDSVRTIEEDGLNPADYHLTRLEALLAKAQGDSEIRGLTDLLLTDAFLRLAYHARFGKLDPEALDSNWNFTGPLLSSDPVSAVQAVIDGGGVREFVDSLKPQHPFYGKLKSALREYRAIAAQGGWPVIPPGPTLEPGMSDTRIPVLRKRLAVTGDLEVVTVADESSTFDAPLETAVRAFQQRHGLKPDAAVGKATLAALSVPVEARIDQIRATLERCRWVMHDLPPRFVLVNVAGFQVFWVQNGEDTWESAAVVGKPYTRTPTFRADMKSIVLNPTWTVPASIVRNELLPAMRRDPGYLARKRIRHINGRYVQSAGDHNALGRIKLL